MSGSVGNSERLLRVLCLVESHEGFGHFNIIDLLSKALQQRGVEVCVASGTLNHPDGVFAFEGANVEELPHVGYSKSRKIFTQPDGSEYLPDSMHAQTRRMAIDRMCSDFQPDVVICELFPFMQPFRRVDIEAIHDHYLGQAARPEIVCLGRDIVHNLTSPSRTINDLNNLFDRVLLRGDERFFRLEESQPEWATIQVAMEYMGVFVEPMPLPTPMPDQERPVVVFSGGGYHDQDLAFFVNTIKARKYSAHFCDNPWEIYVSNNCSSDLFSQLSMLAIQEAPDGKICIKRPVSSEEFKQIEADCTAAFTRAGYNTTFELATISKPMVVVPRTFKEQVQRAEMLERAALAKAYPQACLEDVVALGAMLDEAKITCAVSPLKVSYFGAEHTAERAVKLAQAYRIRKAEKAAERLAETEAFHPTAHIEGPILPLASSLATPHLAPLSPSVAA